MQRLSAFDLGPPRMAVKKPKTSGQAKGADLINELPDELLIKVAMLEILFAKFFMWSRYSVLTAVLSVSNPLLPMTSKY